VIVDASAAVGGEIIQLRAVEPADEPDQASDLKAAVESTLDLNAQRDTIRVPRVTIDPAGEATVQFAVRNSGTDPQAVSAAALDDVKTILSTVSQSTDAPRITSTTVIGTYPVVNESGMVPESIVLRAGLSAARASQIDWSTLAPQDLASALDSFWMHPVLTGEAVPLGVVPDDTSAAGLAGQVASMVGHVNMAIEELSSGDADAARSQFLQFFGTFDDVDDQIDAAFPARFKTLQADVNRVQTAFTSKHRDYDTMRQSLLSLRNTLNGLIGDLQGTGD